ncbi:MAG: hypothetical protein V1743_07440 [Nanoarchaeota archaeon]
MTSFTAIVDEKLGEFVKHANKGLHYSEEIFCAGFTFDDGDDVKEILVSFLMHLDSLTNAKTPYFRFLERNRILDDVKRSLQNPDFGHQISLMIRTELYKRLALHLSASDFLDLAKGGLTSEFYFLKVLRSMGETGFSVESGINLYFIINRKDKELFFLQTVFN